MPPATSALANIAPDTAPSSAVAPTVIGATTETVPRQGPAAAVPVTTTPPAMSNGPPTIIVGPSDVAGGASRRAVNKAVAGATSRIRKCALSAPGAKPGRRASVVFVIDEDAFFIESERRGDGALAACVAQALSSQRLGRRPDTGNVRVEVPIRVEAKP